MTEITHHDPTPEGDTTWLIADEPAPDVVTSAPGRRTALVAVGLVAAGAIVGGVAVAALRPNTSTNASTATNPAGFAAGQGQGGFAGGGGVAGEQRLSGTVT